MKKQETQPEINVKEKMNWALITQSSGCQVMIHAEFELPNEQGDIEHIVVDDNLDLQELYRQSLELGHFSSVSLKRLTLIEASQMTCPNHPDQGIAFFKEEERIAVNQVELS